MTPLQTKVLSRLNKYKIADGDCWRWSGAVTGRDRPKLNLFNKTLSVARLSMWIYKGFDYEKDPLYVLHKPSCKHADCWNPEHLYLGTNDDNMQDKRLTITHCVHGHEYTPANTFINRMAARVCLTCKRSRK